MFNFCLTVVFAFVLSSSLPTLTLSSICLPGLPVCLLYISGCLPECLVINAIVSVD